MPGISEWPTDTDDLRSILEFSPLLFNIVSVLLLSVLSIICRKKNVHVVRFFFRQYRFLVLGNVAS